MPLVTERYLGDHFWWCLMGWIERHGQPLVQGEHVIEISFDSCRWMDAGMSEDNKWKFYRVTRWKHPVAEPNASDLLGVTVEEAVNARIHSSKTTIGRPDAYRWEVLKTLLPKDFDEDYFHTKWLLETTGCNKHAEEVAEEWKELEAARQLAMEEALAAVDSEFEEALPIEHLVELPAGTDIEAFREELYKGAEEVLAGAEEFRKGFYESAEEFHDELVKEIKTITLSEEDIKGDKGKEIDETEVLPELQSGYIYTTEPAPEGAIEYKVEKEEGKKKKGVTIKIGGSKTT